MKIGIVILAAGASVRMGVPKQLLPFRGTTLLQHAINTATAVPEAHVAVVIGANAVQISESLKSPDVLVVDNPDWQEGMGSSIRSGLRALLAAHPDLSAVMIQLCDQPHLSATLLCDLISCQTQSNGAIVASNYNGILGVPALFSRSLFPELLALSGAEGAKKVIANHPDQTTSLPFADGAMDIDTPADFERLLSESPTQSSV